MISQTILSPWKILVFCLLTHFGAIGQTSIKYPKRPTLLVFSGSDWCIPCIQLEKTILSDSSFLHYAEAHLELVRADFPQRKKLSKEQQKQNEALAAQYNPEGAFPKMLLLHPDQSIWTILHWQDHSPQSFTDQIDSFLNSN